MAENDYRMFGTASTYVVSPETAQLTKRLEGFSERAYVDASGHSVGFGHFLKAGEEHMMGKRMSLPAANALLQKDLAEHASEGLRFLKVPITGGQKTAIEALAYNAGPGAAQTVVRLLNEGKVQRAADQFDYYIKSRDPNVKDAQGRPALVVNPKLVARRAWEKSVFLGEANADTTGPGGAVVSRNASTLVDAQRRPGQGNLRIISSAAAQPLSSANADILAQLTALGSRLQVGSLDFEQDQRIIDNLRREGSGR